VNKNDLEKNSKDESDAETLFSVALAERANPGGDPEIAQFNATVRVVKTAFSDHVVHLVPSAAPPGVECSELTNFPLANLSSGYVRAIEILRAEISAEAPRAILGASSGVSKKFMTGRDIANLLEAVLPAANEGSGAFSDRMADAIVRRHTDEIKSELAECVSNLLYPMEEIELEGLMDALVVRELNRYREGPTEGGRTNFVGGNSALSPLLVRNERELEEKIFAERLRAKIVNSERSEDACTAAARAAAARFSREILTSGGTRSSDLKAFDVAVAIARDKYLESAIGPRRQYHADRLDELARAERETVIAETAPARRKAWLVGAGISVVMMQTAKVPFFAILQNCKFLPKMFVELVAPLSVIFAALDALLGTLRNVSAIVAAVAGLSMLGYDASGAFSFDAIADFVTLVAEAASNNWRTATAVATFSIVGFAWLGWYTKRGKHQSGDA